jgi:hypothetical protein
VSALHRGYVSEAHAVPQGTLSRLTAIHLVKYIRVGSTAASLLPTVLQRHILYATHGLVDSVVKGNRMHIDE